MHMTASTCSNRGIRPAFRLGFSACLAFVALVAFAALFSVPAQAQYGASLQGTVTDTTGAVVPGATITLVDKETNRTLNATSNETGFFVFNHLPPSKFTITVTRDGFKKKVFDNVAILSEQANSMTIALEVGAAAETVLEEYMAADLKFAKTHEWVRIEGNVATVGITDFAVHALTDLVFIELPRPGRALRPREVFGVVESVKAASDLYAPIATYDVEVNGSIEDFADFAKEHGATYRELKDLNPWLRETSLVNKAKKTYILKLPQPGAFSVQ